MPDQSIVCPNCQATLVPKASLTPKQTRVVKRLAQGLPETQGESAIKAGMHPESLTRLLGDAGFVLTVELAKGKARDKRLSLEQKSERILAKSLATLGDAPITDPILAGQIAKLSLEIHSQLVKTRLLLGDAGTNTKEDRASLGATLSHIARLAQRYARRYTGQPKPERWVELLERMEQRVA